MGTPIPKEIDFPVERAEQILKMHENQAWFVYALTGRPERWHVWAPSLWLAERISRNARILETGCGCAWNLIWFGQRGFRQLYGFDTDPKAIAAGKDLCAVAGTQATLNVDDGLAPKHLVADFYDVVLALNWTYHLEAFDLQTFFLNYSKYLRPGGYIAIDTIDSAYNTVPNNEYLTSDWNLPDARRRPTEYKKRYTDAEVRSSARQTGLRIVRSEMCDNCILSRRVYILTHNST
jgi:2-polyprenyl-3-methyl-5-hydroxy-6-metoxy-1,4-benzoquinol methylase